jgi:serine O-acetyltransferase|tara:strand:- start:215 stop:739 length:525 start_codon:yes stop_codon:yes gene_type:complete
MISADKADWQRETPRFFWDPSRKLLSSIRGYQSSKNKQNLYTYFHSKLIVLRYRFWSIITGAEIPINGNLGGGLLIPHPNGIVIHPDAYIGVNCLIHQQVTIGVNRKSNKPPTIAGHVDIGAGAKIIGDISIGAHALIGANSVVINDVEAYAIVGGIPAKVIGHTNKNVSSKKI